ncbi:MAG: hypothetical protein A2Y40_08110 [Candidatus Margulisbacteria bacterium GWF2_35_9]|nr:MAG: hypothetical protein A2Y40_08110 [Candidatus Margulisbacteria bacterium GWF2_35_9]
MNRVSAYIVAIAVFLFGFCYAQPSSSNFALNIIDTTTLISQIDNILLIDSRDPQQYKKIHIKGAINLPVYQMTKEDTLKLINAFPQKKTIVFYCNINCDMSQDAALNAMNYNIENVYVYKEGLQTYLRSHPELIEYESSKAEESKNSQYYLDTKEFIEKIKQGYVLIDIRDDQFKETVILRFNNRINLNYKELLEQLSNHDVSTFQRGHFLIMDDFGNVGETLIPSFIDLQITDVFLLNGGMKKWIQDGYNAYGEIEIINFRR